VGENVTVKTKSSTSEERWEGPELINGGAVHPFRLAFWGEGNSLVTNSNSMSYPTFDMFDSHILRFSVFRI